MIRVHRLPDGGAEVVAVLERQPAIYLDHDSLGEIARNEARRRRFLDIWTRRGELLFSWANALDISGPQEGGALRQDGHTQDMTFGVARLLEHASSWTTLEPGDVLLTGTPDGVGPLAAGQRVECELVGVARLSNAVVPA